jgi:hypothetical protein
MPDVSALAQSLHIFPIFVKKQKKRQKQKYFENQMFCAMLYTHSE